MDYTKSTKIAFAYTVKTLGDITTYEPFFDRLNKFSIKVEYKVSELDSKGKLHYHGILYLDKGFFRKRLCVKGYHIKLDELYDRAGWIKYILKDQKKEELETLDEMIESIHEEETNQEEYIDMSLYQKKLF